ncbi:MAG: DNA alkylation repair protein [Elusimicrobiaceae bacterium]|nr:DNA alkylation repair protein [Elusimicrobiaceae bacterium]
MQKKITRKEIEKFLQKNADKKFQKFSTTLTPNAQNIIGVKVPIVKQYAKELTKQNITLKDITLKNDIFEEIMLEGFLIAYGKTDFETFVKEIKNFVPKINNWAHCDLFCSALKRIKKDEDYFFNFIQPYLNSKQEFKVRFGLVILLGYYVKEEYLSFIFETLDNFKHGGYYAKMAAAWLLSVCFVKFPKETFAYTKNSKLDAWTFKKGIEKTKQSFRVSKEFKEKLNFDKIKFNVKFNKEVVI